MAVKEWETGLLQMAPRRRRRRGTLLKHFLLSGKTIGQLSTL
jgi:hypothetical protein